MPAFRRSAAFCCTLAAALSCALALPVRASTVDTFDFSQSGYVGDGNLNNSTGTISGTFSGTPDAAGFISISALTGFSLNGGTALPTFFSYDVNGGPSSFDLAINNNAPDLTGATCIGAAAAFGGNLTGINCGPGGANGYYSTGVVPFFTQQLPNVTLVSTVTTVPEPASLYLFLVALLLCPVLYLRKRRRPANSNYSYLKATVGSTLAARLAGM